MKYWTGRKIWVKLNSNKFYSGNVLEVEYLGKGENEENLWMFTIKDKFDNIVCFPNREINLIEEEK